MNKECVFQAVYRDLYATYKDELSSDSRRRQVPAWLKRQHSSPSFADTD